MSAWLPAGAIVTNGLLAGVFFVCACAVVPGFRRVDDRTYLAAFRAINRAILTGWFLLVFFGAPVSAVAVAVSSPGWLTAAAAASAVVTFGITVAGNVPLNQALERAEVRSDAERRTVRESFEGPWARRNLARTATSVAALAFLALAA